VVHSERADVSPSIAIPLIEAAIDEDRDELKDVWARLLAAALDPARQGLVRQSMIETVKKLDPVDALVFQKVAEKQDSGVTHDDLVAALKLQQDEVAVSSINLVELRLFMHSGGPAISHLAPKGQLLFRVLAD
jgi:hypothetical protein